MVLCPWAVESFALSSLSPSFSEFARCLGHQRRLVRFDGRGTGMSEREPASLDYSDHLLDLDAVVGAAGVGECTVIGGSFLGAAAAAFAAHHPERVSSLILYATAATSYSVASRSLVSGLAEVCETNWDLATQMLTVAGGSDLPDEEVVANRETIRRSIDGPTMARWLRGLLDVDVTDDLPQIEARTLVLHRLDDPVFPFAEARTIAASIPGARLVALDGNVHQPSFGDWRALVRAVDDFLGDGGGLHALETRGVRAVLFSDLAGHTDLMRELGDDDGRALLREHEEVTRRLLTAHGGTEIKTMGDGFMASFSSVVEGTRCAIELQRAFARRNAGAEVPLHVRIGINAGEPIEESGDLFGASVIIAARLASEAPAGEIFVPEGVRHLLSGKSFSFGPRGERLLKGFDEPIRIYAVDWTDGFAAGPVEGG